LTQGVGWRGKKGCQKQPQQERQRREFSHGSSPQRCQ
jgi:hypothetical protein